MSKFIINVDDQELKIEKAAIDTLNISKIDDTNFHLLHNRKAYAVELLNADFLDKRVTLTVNGNSYQVNIEDSYDQLVKKMGLLTVTSQKAKDIKAPMPGLIIDIMVEEGQEILEGTALIILSAMKMENILLAQTDGVIKSINVKKEDTVDKGQIIIEME